MACVTAGNFPVSRLSPLVDRIQMASPYTNVFTSSEDYVPSDSQPKPPRFSGPRGWGRRHVNDPVPFSLWNDADRRFRIPSPDERIIFLQQCQAESVQFLGHLAIIMTSNPPQPLPLTVASMPAIFVPSSPNHWYSMLGRAPYANAYIPDPCPALAYPRMSFPSHETATGICETLYKLANIRQVYFFPLTIVVELDNTDGQSYEPKSLPSKVATLPVTYHHSKDPFLDIMKDRVRERVIDPSHYLPDPQIGPFPQDETNYLAQPGWGFLCPGMRVSTGPALSSRRYDDIVASTTSGVLLQKGNFRCLTVANHGFLDRDEVHHPTSSDDKVGDIIDRYPEIDVAMVKLTPATSTHFLNNVYFKATPPARLIDSSTISPGSWFEADTMSTGLVTFMLEGVKMERPALPPGHPHVPCCHWRRGNVMRIFGTGNQDLIDGMCGAPFVECDTGAVAGFFHLANGDHAVCATLDDLVAEGWSIC